MVVISKAGSFDIWVVRLRRVTAKPEMSKIFIIFFSYFFRKINFTFATEGYQLMMGAVGQLSSTTCGVHTEYKTAPPMAEILPQCILVYQTVMSNEFHYVFRLVLLTRYLLSDSRIQHVL